MKLRFSLRKLLLLTACLAAFCYWRDRPRQIADRFVAAVDARDRGLTDSLFVSGTQGPWVFEFGGPDGEYAAVRETQSPLEWLKGQCRVVVEIKQKNWQFHGVVSFLVTAQGVEVYGVSSRPL